jgi:hypothetical protein
MRSFVSLSILIFMYAPFCLILLFCVLFVCKCVLDFSPQYIDSFLYLILLFQVGVSKILSVLLLNFQSTIIELVFPVYSNALVSTGNMFRDLPRLCEPGHNTEHYI